MLDRLIEEHAVALFFGIFALIFLFVWIKTLFDEKKGINSPEKLAVNRILQALVPEYTQSVPVYAYWRLNTGRHSYKCWYYALALTTTKLYIVPLVFAGTEVGHGQPVVISKEQLGSVDCGKPGGKMHFIKLMDKNQNKILELIVEERNTKLDKTYPVNIMQEEETRAFMQRLEQWQNEIG